MIHQLSPDLIAPHLWGDHPSSLVTAICQLDPEDQDTRVTCAVLLPMVASVNTMRILLDPTAAQQLMLLDAQEPPEHPTPAVWPSQGTIYFEFCEPVNGDADNTTIHGVLFSPPDPDGNRTALVPVLSPEGLTVRGINIDPNSFQAAPAPGESPSLADRTALRRYRHLIHLTTCPENVLTSLPMSPQQHACLEAADSPNPWLLIRPATRHK